MVYKRLPKDLEQRLFDLTLALYRVTDFFPPGEALRKHLREKANEIFSQVLEYSYVENADNAILKIFGKIQSIRGYLEIAKSLRVVKSINLIILEREYIFLANFFDKPLNTNSASESLDPTKEIFSTPNSADPTMNLKPADQVVLPGEVTTKTNKNRLSSWQDFSRGNLDSPSFGRTSLDGGSSLEDQPNLPRFRENEAVAVRLGGPLLLNERQEVILEHLKQTQLASSGVGCPRVKVSDFYSFFGNISSKTVQRDLQGLVAKKLLRKEGEKRWTVYTLINFNVQ